MKIKSIISNDYLLEASGSFITYDKGLTSIALEFSQKVELTIEFKFLKKEGGKQEVSAEITDGKISLTLHNFDNPLGTGTARPAFIGLYEHRLFFFQYRVHALDNDSDKLVHYSFYSKKVDQPSKAANKDVSK